MFKFQYFNHFCPVYSIWSFGIETNGCSYACLHLKFTESHADLEFIIKIAVIPNQFTR